MKIYNSTLKNADNCVSNADNCVSNNENGIFTNEIAQSDFVGAVSIADKDTLFTFNFDKVPTDCSAITKWKNNLPHYQSLTK